MGEKPKKSDISVLGEDLLVEILCRLGSVKYATQCKSVCKLWRSLLHTNSHWLRRWCHMNRCKESVTLITHIQDREAIEIKIDYRGKNRSIPTVRVNLKFLPCFNCKNQVIRVLGSHKDLLLCCPNFSDQSCYYICNAFTKQWTALPPPPPIVLHLPTKYPLPCINYHTQVGFLVDEGVDGGLQFTVVRIVAWGSHDGRVEVCIFTSDGGWREMDDDGEWREMFQAYRLCKKIVSYKGRLVWLMGGLSSQEVRVCSWDLHSNFTRLPLVTSGYTTNDKHINMSTIGVYEGRLRMALLLDDHKKLIVWQFDDSQRQDWDMMLELDLSPLGKDLNRGFKIDTQGMTFHGHDGDILYMQVNMVCNENKASSHILTCNLKTRRLELMRKVSMHSVSGAKLFPLVKNCWPTPVPRLQP